MLRQKCVDRRSTTQYFAVSSILVIIVSILIPLVTAKSPSNSGNNKTLTIEQRSQASRGQQQVNGKERTTTNAKASSVTKNDRPGAVEAHLVNREPPPPIAANDDSDEYENDDENDQHSEQSNHHLDDPIELAESALDLQRIAKPVKLAVKPIRGSADIWTMDDLLNGDESIALESTIRAPAKQEVHLITSADGYVPVEAMSVGDDIQAVASKLSANQPDTNNNNDDYQPDLITAAGHHYPKHSHSKYYMYAQSHKKGDYDSGYKVGGHKLTVSGHSSTHHGHTYGHVKWYGKKGKGSHTWELNHGKGGYHGDHGGYYGGHY
ncbi:hypothetical protein GZH46_01054 [Fragariocoptes setiger]|uniref:Uncharacterized protein n=1 Tax=Fragariocoptes setiger TaxID=1670756 RepID=A0ABQ7SAJ8_9ACAR|nr:hypothetical protein GZH46_01054 [Fragariocoptes setiger]